MSNSWAASIEPQVAPQEQEGQERAVLPGWESLVLGPPALQPKLFLSLALLGWEPAVFV